MPHNKPPIAILDIGSNSVRLCVYEAPYLDEKPVFNEKVQCALGRDLDTTGCLSPQGAQQALKTIYAFAQIADAMGIRDIHAIGTAALRDAADAPDFLKAVREKCGIDIQVISGEDEATYSAWGVIMHKPGASGVVADLGGGSLELARIGGKRIIEPCSFPLGALRILAQDDAPGYLAKYFAQFPAVMKKPQTLYLVGGNWRELGEAMDKTSGKADKFQSFAQEVASTTPDDLMSQYHIEEKRALLLPAAAYLLDRLIDHLQPAKIYISPTGLRDGVLAEIVSRREGESRAPLPAEPSEP